MKIQKNPISAMSLAFCCGLALAEILHGDIMLGLLILALGSVELQWLLY